MPIDWNNRDEVEQALLKARNAGVSDEDFAAYAKEKRASMAGTTLQKFGARAQAELPVITNIRPISPIQTPREAVSESSTSTEAFPYLFGAPGQAVKEGIDAAMAHAAGMPELSPTIPGAAARVGTIALAPKVLQGAAYGLGKLGGFAGPAMNRVMASDTGQAVKLLYGRVTSALKNQVGTEIATTAAAQKGSLQATALAKDAFIEGLDKGGKQVNTLPLINALKEAIPEEATKGSNVVAQARNQLLAKAEDLASLTNENGQAGLGSFMTFRDNFGTDLYKATNPTLRSKLVQMKQLMDSHLMGELGPADMNHIGALETATSNRLQIIRRVYSLFSKNAEGAVKRAMGNDAMQRALGEFSAQTGEDVLTPLQELAAKQSFNSAERQSASSILTRVAGSSAIGYGFHSGPAGFLTYLLTSPSTARQAAKLGLLLSTTSIPRLATTGLVNAVAGPEQPTP